MGKHLHKIIVVDEATLTGVCRHCGSVRVVKKQGKREGGYRCHVAYQAKDRKSRRWKQNRYTAHKKQTCERCGFVPEHPCQLDVHHKDGDHSNNDPANLQTLCANCHRLITWEEQNGIYRFHKNLAATA